MAETSIRHIVFHLTENGLWLYASPASKLYAFFRSEQFAGLLLVGFQAMIPFYYPLVPLSLEASATEWTSPAVLCSVSSPLRYISACALLAAASSACHVLSHRAYAIVVLLVVIEILRAERVRSVPGMVLYMETVVFHISSGSVAFHELVVFL